MNALQDIRIVLIRPTHPGNIGGVARAMKNMGLSSLYLVAPKEFPSPVATTRAAGAHDLLLATKVVDRLEQAIGDCSLVIGTSARQRSIGWPQLSPQEAMSRCYAESLSASAAIVFGQESIGLTNCEVDCCQFLVNIPTDDRFRSLNLVSAVQIMTYELRLAYLRATPDVSADKPVASPMRLATVAELTGFFEHLEQVLSEFEFLKARPPTKLLRKLIRLFNRARPTQEEINILRGVLTAVQRQGRRPNS